MTFPFFRFTSWRLVDVLGRLFGTYPAERLSPETGDRLLTTLLILESLCR